MNTRDGRPKVGVALHATTEADLEALLSQHGVDWSAWGTGDSKTVRHLLRELTTGSCVLTTDSEGLVRTVRNVWVEVFADVDDTRMHLVEVRQRFRDGRVRERQLPASLGEKCNQGESPIEAARRCLEEELGILVPRSLQPMAAPAAGGGPVTDGKTSYPSLRSRFESYWYIAEIDNSDFNPDGYIESQWDKETFFVWRS